jgi:hypothetical protein
VIVRSDIHDRLALPTESSMIKRNTWEETPKLHVAFEPMIERIKHLTSHNLLAMMLLHDFLSRHITPLQDCAHQAWMYTGEGDATRLECDCDSDLDPDVLGALLARLSPDPSSADFITPPMVCAPMCSNHVMQMRLLRELPTLDDIDITMWRRGDESRGVHIPGADVANGQGGPSTSPGSGKGKGKAAPQIVLSDIEVLLEEDDAPLQRRMSLLRSGGSTTSRPLLSR